MPIYDFECEKCKKETQTLRTMSESDLPPEEKGDDRCEEHKWIKVIKSAPQKKLGPNWGPGKGYYNSGGW